MNLKNNNLNLIKIMKNNWRTDSISIRMTGYGHWKISIERKGKTLSTITTDVESIDDYNTESDEKDGREFRKKRGYGCLRNEILRAYSLITIGSNESKSHFILHRY